MPMSESDYGCVVQFAVLGPGMLFVYILDQCAPGGINPDEGAEGCFVWALIWLVSIVFWFVVLGVIVGLLILSTGPEGWRRLGLT